MITAQVVLINEDGYILGVSRKTNHSDFGLAGGKMDVEDGNDPKKTAIRETKEETGLDIYDLELVFAIHKSGNMGFTYLAKYRGEINYDEPHVVKWVTMEHLVNGSFGRYNQMVSESLDSMGVMYQKKIDLEPIEIELNQYVTKTILKGYSKPFDSCNLIKYFGETTYRLRLFMDGLEPFEDLNEVDKDFIDGFTKIGANHSISIRMVTEYYSK